MTIVYSASPAEGITATFAYNTAGVASGIFLGTVPKDAKIMVAQMYIATGFNAQASAAINNQVYISISAATGQEFFFHSDAAVTTTAVIQLPKVFAYAWTAPRTVYVRYVQSGTAATAGLGYVTIQWGF